MKIAFLLKLAAFACLTATHVCSSESLHRSESAVETLRDSLEAHPEKALGLFRESLRANPDLARALLAVALRTLGDDPAAVIPILYAARLEHPEEDAVFAEVTIETLPDLARELLVTFAASPEKMRAALEESPRAREVEEFASRARVATSSGLKAEFAAMDEEIRAAIVRADAKSEARSWPGEAAALHPMPVKKNDEVRVSRGSLRVDESSLTSHLMLDRTDEREISPGSVKIDDAWRPSREIRLDETKFLRDGGEAFAEPLEARVKSMSPAGSVGLPKRPVLKRSSVYRIPPVVGSYESTIDIESAEDAPPALIIRPEPASPTTPK
ncbi:MAG: hypothetical protein B9S36_04035 [Verrucomicrobiia bacterium Tous-C2TDCM]|nr:MAG: hypothetical protein B9S36_04035 [Verrucomicrobiae bacterium Tous-C2TDCM]